jgi:hypothetical protein
MCCCTDTAAANVAAAAAAAAVPCSYRLLQFEGNIYNGRISFNGNLYFDYTVTVSAGAARWHCSPPASCEQQKHNKITLVKCAGQWMQQPTKCSAHATMTDARRPQQV